MTRERFRCGAADSGANHLDFSNTATNKWKYASGATDFLTFDKSSSPAVLGCGAILEMGANVLQFTSQAGIYSDGSNGLSFRLGNTSALASLSSAGVLGAASAVLTGSVQCGTVFKVGTTSGISTTVALAKLTPGGAAGTLTTLGGIVTAYTAPT